VTISKEKRKAAEAAALQRWLQREGRTFDWLIGEIERHQPVGAQVTNTIGLGPELAALFFDDHTINGPNRLLIWRAIQSLVCTRSWGRQRNLFDVGPR
jgi:hypothetical protein